MKTILVPVEVREVICLVCGVTAPAIVVEAMRADACGAPPGDDPTRLIARSWRTPAGWGRCSFEASAHGGLSGDLCPKCVKKVGAGLYELGFKEPRP